MKLIFLDRDGVINKDPGGWTEYSYVTSLKEFLFLPGSLGGIRGLTEAGFEIVIISNQAGINKGYYTLDSLNKITEFMLSEIEKSGGRIASVYYCPHKSEENCDCRKPRAGLFGQAAAGRDIDFGKTYFVGDGGMDVEAGKEIGCKTILVLSGKSKPEDIESWKVKPDYIKKDLKEAVDWILSGEVK